MYRYALFIRGVSHINLAQDIHSGYPWHVIVCQPNTIGSTTARAFCFSFLHAHVWQGQAETKRAMWCTPFALQN